MDIDKWEIGSTGSMYYAIPYKWTAESVPELQRGSTEAVFLKPENQTVDYAQTDGYGTYCNIMLFNNAVGDSSLSDIGSSLFEKMKAGLIKMFPNSKLEFKSPEIEEIGSREYTWYVIGIDSGLLEFFTAVDGGNFLFIMARNINPKLLRKILVNLEIADAESQ
jgi:hypothetical protein